MLQQDVVAVAPTPGRLTEVVVQQAAQGQRVMAAFLEAEAARAYLERHRLRLVGDVSMLSADGPSAAPAAVASMGRRLPGQPGRVMACYSPRGGAGTSLLASALASHAATACGLSTLLIDLDLQNGSQAFVFDITDARRHSVMGLKPLVDEVLARCDGDLERVREEAPKVITDEILVSRAFCVSERLRVLCALEDPAAIDDYTDPGSHVEALLTIAAGAFDLVVVDVPSTVDAFTAPALFRADRVALVALEDIPSQIKVARMLNLVIGPMIRARGLDLETTCRLTVNRTSKPHLEVPMPIAPSASLPDDSRYLESALIRRQPLDHLAQTPYGRAVAVLATHLGLSPDS